MQNRTLIIVIATLLISNLFLLGVFVFGKQDKKPASPRKDFSPIEYMSKEIGFDSAQKKEFRVMWENVSKKNKDLYDSIRLQRDRLYKNLGQDPQPDSLIQSITAKMAGFEQQVSLNNYEHFRKVHSLCNAEQKIKLDTVISKIAKRWKRH